MNQREFSAFTKWSLLLKEVSWDSLLVKKKKKNLKQSSAQVLRVGFRIVL